MMYISRTDDPLADFNRYENVLDRELKKRPICSFCGEYIQDDYMFKIEGDVLCEDCLNDCFRFSVDDFILE